MSTKGGPLCLMTGIWKNEKLLVGYDSVAPIFMTHYEIIDLWVYSDYFYFVFLCLSAYMFHQFLTSKYSLLLDHVEDINNILEIIKFILSLF